MDNLSSELIMARGIIASLDEDNKKKVLEVIEKNRIFAYSILRRCWNDGYSVYRGTKTI